MARPDSATSQPTAPSPLPTVVVLGGTGFLGPAIVRALTDRAETIAGGSSLVDIRNASAVRELIRQANPTAVINAAAAGTSADAALQHAVNADGAANVAAAATAAGARLVHVSTDVVHDGTAAPYADDAPSSPIGSYGTTKAAGETAVADRCPEAALVRSSLIWDPARIDPPTAGFAQRLESGQPLTLWQDVLRQPVHAADLAALLVILALDAPEVSGTLNAGGADVLSRADFGRLMLDHFDIPGRASMRPTPAPDGVPKDIRLRTGGAERLGARLRGVTEVLAAYQ